MTSGRHPDPVRKGERLGVNDITLFIPVLSIGEAHREPSLVPLVLVFFGVCDIRTLVTQAYSIIIHSEVVLFPRRDDSCSLSPPKSNSGI